MAGFSRSMRLPRRTLHDLETLTRGQDVASALGGRDGWVRLDSCHATFVPTHGPGHLRTFDYIGLYRYFLTFCTDSRSRLFTTSRVVDLVLSQIERTANEEQFAVVAYCFMPDHLHLLVEARVDSSDGRRFIRRAKQYSGFYYARTFKQRLWQRYSFEHVLRDDEVTLGVARYILENPLRGRLALRVDDYPFTGSGVYTLEQILAAVAEAPRT